MDNKTKVLIGGGIAASVIGFFAFKKIRDNARNKAAAKAIVKGNDSTLGINIPEIAKQIGIDLGTAYPPYDPRSWSENDLAVSLLVRKVPKTHIPVLSREYSRFYPGRILQDDLQKLLDDYNEISYLFKQ
jgi:hypothetical protein